ncbi:MAG: hypothetical protein WC998_07650 [Candidatus Paceibacterota bacterium]|jgi:hypothetical protein
MLKDGKMTEEQFEEMKTTIKVTVNKYIDAVKLEDVDGMHARIICSLEQEPVEISTNVFLKEFKPGPLKELTLRIKIPANKI